MSQEAPACSLKTDVTVAILCCLDILLAFCSKKFGRNRDAVHSNAVSYLMCLAYLWSRTDQISPRNSSHLSG